MNTHNDPMARMPTLPSDTTPIGAALWACTILLNEAVRQGWPRAELRTAVLVLALNVVAHDLDDEQAHAEVQRMLDLLRAGGAVPQ
jgi:hypothetical protein